MRKPVVDFKDFKLSKLATPQYNHLLYSLGWVFHFVLFALTEKLIPAEKCFPMHAPLDDVIPFCEVFILPYVLWYFLIIGTLTYYMFYNPENYKGLMKFIIICSAIAMFAFVVFPSRQDLRPQEFLNDNFCVDLVKCIYSIDTNTNVCPSMHVAVSIGIASSWIKEKSASTWVKTLLVAFCVLVCISVAFVKQHSVIDIFVAIPICIIAELIAFKSYRKILDFFKK